MSPIIRIRELRRTAVGVALWAGIALSGSAAADEALAATRQAFVREYAAVMAGAGGPAEADSAELRAYALYPYLQRARIEQALGDAGATPAAADAAASAFLTARQDEPVTTELRRTWLKSLAARGEWATFSEHYQPRVADAVLNCHWLRAEIALRGGETAKAAVAAQWLTAERLPPECEPAFEWLRAEHAMTTELVERRVRLLLDVGQTTFARTIAQRLPATRAAPLVQWADLLDRPAQGIDALLANPERAKHLDDSALLAGWHKLARNDPAAALERHERLRRLLGRDETRLSRYTLALALGLAWDRRAAEALHAFRTVAAADLDDQALAWRARAALWAGDWRQTERSIEAMSAAQQDEPRWRYWRARAAAERGDAATARALYTALLPRDNFYAASAAARLGRPAAPHPEPLAPDAAAIAALEAQPGIVRARELLAAQLRVAAVGEWLSAIGPLEPAVRTQAVHLATRWQWHDVAVATATRQGVFFDYALLYPRPYDAEVDTAAALTQLEAPLLYAVIRQESLFRHDAVSTAGAVGLAQLRLATARDVARSWRRPQPRSADLLDPATNIVLGAAHLTELLESFEQQAAPALAGYNAGRSVAERWLPSEPLDADIWIENIPYNETRDYVQRVLWHRVVFGWLDGAAGQDFTSWLAPITPRRARSGDVTTDAG